jgi:hypothetical protein
MMGARVSNRGMTREDVESPNCHDLKLVWYSALLNAAIMQTAHVLIRWPRCRLVPFVARVTLTVFPSPLCAIFLHKPGQAAGGLTDRVLSA